MDKKPRIERRQSKRIPIELDVTFGAESIQFQGTTVNVSTRGFLLRTDTTPTVGATLPFRLNLKEKNVVLEFFGRVTHVDHDSQGRAVGIGVEIAQILSNQDANFDAYRSFIERKGFLQVSPKGETGKSRD